MDKNEIFSKLQDVFRDCFDDEDIVLTRETSAPDIDGWDSLMHMVLIGAVEDAFKIKFKMKDVIAMKNVGDFVDLIDASLSQ